jgi:hypothetical protein
MQAVEGEGKAPSAPNLDSNNLEQLKKIDTTRP